MKYELHIGRGAAKVIAALDKPIRRRMLIAIESLAEDPRPQECRKLAGSADTWRIRVAKDWRVIYEIHDRVLLIVVVGAGHRREVYRGQ